jgi:hypothetical protein
MSTTLEVTSINTGDGISSITIEDTSGGIGLTIGSGNSHTISLAHTGGAAIINAMNGNQALIAFNTNGSLTAACHIWRRQ